MLLGGRSFCFRLRSVVVHYGVISLEERYLERIFGDVYRQYLAKVRRWLYEPGHTSTQSTSLWCHSSPPSA